MPEEDGEPMLFGMDAEHAEKVSLLTIYNFVIIYIYIYVYI